MADRPRYRSFVHDSSRWDGFEFRDEDIVITTPPKCGTTWMQMLCALLLFRTTALPAPLAELSPWLDMQTQPLERVRAHLDGQRHRRFIKTHTPLDGLPFDPRVTYLHVARDPRDAGLSWDNHMSNMDLDRLAAIRVAAVGADDLEELGMTGAMAAVPDEPAARFWQWVEGTGLAADISGLGGLVAHASAAWARRDEPNVHLFHYGDLRTDLAGQMHRLAGILGVDPPTADLVEAATFERMKADADRLVPNSDTPFWRDNARFFDRARSGDWRAYLVDDDAVRRYEKAVAAVASQDLAAWLHDGWLGSRT
jgi:hypothetical protein